MESEDEEIIKMIQDLLGYSYQINYERIVEDHNSHIKENEMSFKAAIDKISENVNYEHYYDETSSKLQRSILKKDLPATRNILDDDDDDDDQYYKISKKPLEQSEREYRYPTKSDLHAYDPQVSIWEETHARRSPPKSNSKIDQYYGITTNQDPKCNFIFIHM